MDPVSQSIVGTAVGKLFIVTRTIMSSMVSSKSSCEELNLKLLSLKPSIDEISKLSSDSGPAPHRGHPFKDFQAQLQDGLHLVKKLERMSSFNLYRRYRYGKKILKVENNLNDFLLTQGLEPIVDLKVGSEPSERIEEMGRHIMDSVNVKMTNDGSSNSFMLHQMSSTKLFESFIDGLHDTTMAEQSTDSGNSQVPAMPNFVVGLNNLVDDVKQILFQKGVSIVGLEGMGGSGKTTLALALCNDPQVKDFFQNNIVFIPVSQSPNVKNVLETMWDKIIGARRPAFQSIEDAHNQLQTNLSLKRNRQTLVVLDDVWSISDVEQLMFEAEGYKTVITTRQDYTFPHTDSGRAYTIPMLQKADALSLFCFWAFGQPSIPTTEDEDLIKQVEAVCMGLPLALKVIGSSLRNEPHPVWENAKKKLSRSESISEHHREDLLHCLETSIDVLDDDSKECFLDLGAFPKGRKFSVDSLLDIWVYVRGMEWQDAFMVLLELAGRNLLNLTSDPGSLAISFGCACELSFSQHDLMRDLAFRLARQDSTIHCNKRLFMPGKKDSIPKDWSTIKDYTSRVQFVSIHTGAMEEQDWCQIDFSEVEALALFFAASQYCLPTFLHTMPKLKVLIMYNYGSKRSVLNGLPGFSSVTQLKSVLFEKLIMPSLYEYCRSWENLEKLYVCLCEGLGNMTLFDKAQVVEFPKFLEITFDHCSDLEELSGNICNLISLERWSVTNCHLIQKLPDDLGRLSSLRLLRLSACPSLSMLPPSICSLQQLEFLDISLCSSLKDLPMEFDQLLNLKILDMRECSGLKMLPKTLTKLRSLKRVICDKHTEQQWLAIKASAMPNLTVDVVEERFNLDWLDD